MTVNTFESMFGKTMATVSGCSSGSEEMILTSDDGHRFRFRHEQDCCESVSIEDVCGDPADLIGSPIVVAEEVSSDGASPPDHEYVDSYTWTFYKFATNKGAVTVRWLGKSNGYYSEGVDFDHFEPGAL